VGIVAGTCSADFFVPWEDQGTWDIKLGSHGEAAESDPDGDNTQRSWGIPNPAISVETPFSVWSTGEGWIEGATATLTVDDGSGGAAEYTDTTVIQRWGPDPSEVGFDFQTDPFEILPGFVVTVADGTTTQVLDVVGVTVDSVDEELNVVSGSAPGETWVNVNAGNDWDGCGFDVLSEVDGSWVADFSGDPCYMDLAPGFGGAAQVYDAEGDSSHRSWYLANPVIHVDPQHDRLAGFGWPGDGSVTIQIDEDTDPGNGMLGEWTGLPVDPGGDVWFDVPHDAGFDLAAGHFVRVIDEASVDPFPTKETQVNP
jgi:hypothetical protein